MQFYCSKDKYSVSLGLFILIFASLKLVLDSDFFSLKLLDFDQPFFVLFILFGRTVCILISLVQEGSTEQLERVNSQLKTLHTQVDAFTADKSELIKLCTITKNKADNSAFLVYSYTVAKSGDLFAKMYPKIVYLYFF